MSNVFVESVPYVDSATLATYTFTGFASTIAIGDLLVLGWTSFTTTRTVSTVADNSTQAGTANSYTARSPINSSGTQGGTIYCLVTRSILTTDTVTITLNSTSTRRSGLLLRFTGATGTLDQTASIASGSTSPVTIGPTPTLASAGELAVGFTFVRTNSGTPTVGDTAGYTLVQGLNTNSGTNFIECDAGYKLNAGGSTTTDVHTYTSISQVSGELLTFTPVGGPPPAVPFSLALLGVGV